MGLIRRMVRGIVARKRFWVMVALIALVLCVAPQAAMAQVALSPDIGVDLGDFVPLIAAALGGLVGLILGVAFGFLIIRKGYRWVTRYAG